MPRQAQLSDGLSIVLSMSIFEDPMPAPSSHQSAHLSTQALHLDCYCCCHSLSPLQSELPPFSLPLLRNWAQSFAPLRLATPRSVEAHFLERAQLRWQIPALVEHQQYLPCPLREQGPLQSSRYAQVQVAQPVWKELGRYEEYWTRQSYLRTSFALRDLNLSYLSCRLKFS